MEKPLEGQRKNARRRKKALRRPSALLRFSLFASALVLPVPAAAAARTLRLLDALAPDGGPRTLGMPAHRAGFCIGAMAFCAAYAVVRIPPRAYVFVHEATHALFALLCGVRPRNLRVEAETGSVEVSRPNAIILLAPYFFPLPAAAAALAFGLVSLFIPLAGTAAGAWFAAAPGAAWGFHLCFTVNALLQRQTDLDAYGFFFSVSLTLLLNLAFLLALDVALGPASAGLALSVLCDETGRAFFGALDGLFSRIFRF